MVVFPKKAGVSKSGDSTVCSFVNPNFRQLIIRERTSPLTSPDPPFPSPHLTRPKLLDKSPLRRRSSLPSGPSESPEPTRGTLESELLELLSKHRRKQQRTSNLLVLYSAWDTRVVSRMHDFHTGYFCMIRLGDFDFWHISLEIYHPLCTLLAELCTHIKSAEPCLASRTLIVRV